MKLTLDVDIQTHRKSKAISSAIFNAYNRYGFPRNVLKPIYDRNTAEHMARMFFFWMYKMQEDPPKRPVAYIRKALDNNYPFPEMFHYWLKSKKPEILKGKYSDDVKKLAGVV